MSRPNLSRNLKWAPLLAGVILAVAPDHASATSIGTSASSCRLILTADRDGPDAVKAILARQDVGAVYVCEPVSGAPPSYLTMSPIQRSASGVCHYVSRQITADGSVVATRAARPWARYMMATDEPCPRQDSSGYVLASEVSDGVFLLLVSFVDQLRSEAAIDASFIDARLWRQSIDYQELKAAILGNGSDASRARITRVELSDITPAEPPRYEIDVAGAKSSWGLMVDFSSAGVRILEFGEIHN